MVAEVGEEEVEEVVDLRVVRGGGVDGPVLIAVVRVAVVGVDGAVAPAAAAAAAVVVGAVAAAGGDDEAVADEDALPPDVVERQLATAHTVQSGPVMVGDFFLVFKGGRVCFDFFFVVGRGHTLIDCQV